MEKQQSQKTSKTQEKQLNSYARYSSMVFQMVAIIVIGTYIGVTLDEKYPNTHNLFTLVFTLGSVIAAMVYIIRRIIATSENDN